MKQPAIAEALRGLLTASQKTISADTLYAADWDCLAAFVAVYPVVQKGSAARPLISQLKPELAYLMTCFVASILEAGDLDLFPHQRKETR